MNKEARLNISAGTVARTICLVLALINQVLVIFEISPIPVDDEQIELLITSLVTISMALITWWKNNSITQSAIKADELMHQLKKEKDLHG